MQRLNIIPGKLKKEIKMKEIYASVRKVSFLVLISIFAYAIILLLAKTVLETHLNDTIIQSSLVTKTTQDYVQKVKDINSQIDQIAEIQKNNVEWSHLLDYLAGQSADNNIEFNKIDIDKKTNTLTLNGKSKTRDDLLAFKNSLESIEYFQELNFPIKNLLDKENISFDISLKIKNYEFSNF